MRKIFTFLMILCPVLPFAQNILVNPGFESSVGAEWIENGATITIIDKTSEPDNVYAGDYACFVNTVTANNKGIKSKAVSPDEGAYIGSAWIKATQGATFKVQMVVKENGNTHYITNNFDDVATGSWQNISVACAVPSGGSVQIALQSRQASDFYVDDLEILKISDVANGDFESGVDKYWSDIILKNGAQASITDEASIVQEGSNAIKLQITTVGTSDSWGDVQSASSSLIAFNGAPKVVSFYAKADADTPGDETTGGLGFGYKNLVGKHQAGENNYGGVFQLTSNYRQYKWAIGATDYATYIYAGPSLRCGPSIGAYYFDNITIEAYPGTPTITSTAVTSAHVGTAYSYIAESSNPGLGKWLLTKPETGAEWLSIDQYTGELSGTPDAVSSFEVTVTLSDGIAEIPQTFTIDVSAATAIDDVVSGLKIYPNPVLSELNIASDARVSKVEIFNLTGQKVLADYTGSKYINVADLNKGVYIVSVEADGQVIRKKISKQ